MISNAASYSVSGREERGVIVALHGVTDNAAALSGISRRWGTEWRVYLVDALGHGLSRRFHDDDLADPFTALVAAARAVVIDAARHAVSRKVVLMGHSMGGAIAAAIAREVPDLVQALVLEDPALLTDTQRQAYADTARERVAHQDAVTADPSHAIAELKVSYPAWPAAEYGAWAQGKAQVDRRFLATGVVSGRGRELRAELAVPTLLLTGDGGDVLFGAAGLAQAEALANPHLSTALIPDATHTVRRDRPEEFYQVVNEFLGCHGQDPQPAPYIADELASVLDTTPSQDMARYHVVRRQGEDAFGGASPGAGVTVETVVVGAVPLRCLRGDGEPTAAVLSIHGGGYVAGEARFDDARNADLVELFGGAVVASPDYRLAPEYPWPAGATDCADALRYLAQTYPGLPLYVLGDSAGAGLAQQAIALLAESGEPVRIERAFVLEPCLEPGMDTGSFATYRDGPIWTREASAASWRHYLGDPRVTPPYVPSRRAAALMPPTLIVVNPADPLRDEGLRLAQDLADAGVPVELHMFPGTFHGALSVPSSRTWHRVKEAMRAFLATPMG